MAADSKANIKTLRVDNWAVFFLQRLQLMFAKGDACDLTLKFHTGEELKVHRLVLITCTTFFEDLAKDVDSIQMPEDLPYTAVQPIINFLYSGKLEFKPELHAQLLSISKSLDITILSKLLITQKNDNGLGIIMKTEDKKTPQRTFLATRISGPTSSKNIISGKKLPIWRQRSYPFFKPPERRIIKDEEPKPRRFDWPDAKEPRDVLVFTTPSFTPLSFESEPVFTAHLPSLKGVSSINSRAKDSSVSSSLTPLKRPSAISPSTPDKIFKVTKKESHISEQKRENLPIEVADYSDDDDGHFETIHSFGDSDDELETGTPVHAEPASSQSAAQPTTPVPVEPPESCSSRTATPSRSYPSPASNQQNLQPSSTDKANSADDVVEDIKSSADPPTSVVSPAPAVTSPPAAQLVHSTPKPILKPLTESTPGHAPAKKVRFSLVSEKKEELTSIPVEECTEDSSSDTAVPQSSLNVTPITTSDILPSTSSSSNVIEEDVHLPAQDETSISQSSHSEDMSSAETDDSMPSGSMFKSSSPTTYSAKSPKTMKKVAPAVATNHAKIIAEVLKKYPELVRNNKNIRLKISSPGTTNVTNLLTLDTKKTEGKSSYMVVKSYVKTEKGVKSAGNSFAIAASTSGVQKPVKIGTPDQPWTCTVCSKPDNPVLFFNYGEYRLHMTQVHHEKIDPRICEHCGYKTAKRNLLLYHLFTKHRIDPPQNVVFPKCDLCGYIAMSDTLLQRHVLTHKSLTDWPCPKCHILFKSSQSLRVHLLSCKIGQTLFSCEHCNEKFESNVLLNDHSSICSANPSIVAEQHTVDLTSLPPTESPPPQPLPSTALTHSVNNSVSQVYDARSDETNSAEQNVEMIEVPLLDSESIGTKEHTFIQLPNGLILVPTQPQQMRRSSADQPMENVGNEVRLIRNGGAALEQMGVNQNITLLSSAETGDPVARNQMGLTMALPQDQHVILLDANSEFFIQGNDSVVVTRLNDAAEEYIVPEVMDEGMQELYPTQSLPYSVATSANTTVSVPSGKNVSSSEHLAKQDDNCGSTVVRVQNSSDLESVQMQHPDEMDTIIVHDVPHNTNSMEEQHHLYSEEPTPRQHMTINKELMDVVAMEVQRSPNFIETTNVTLGETPQTHHTVLRQSTSGVRSQIIKPKEVNPASNLTVYRRIQPREDVQSADDSVEKKLVIGDAMETDDLGDTKKAAEEVQEEVLLKEDYDSEEERMAQQTAAKADSFVKDWGFDNEEESDAAELVADDSDEENDENDHRIGPSRVTVEL